MKRVLLISLVMIICLSSLSLAVSFSDVKGTKFEEPVNILTSLSIISGYEDGTYKPEKTVTRAEMAKLIITALAKESTAESLKGETKFSDVKESSWASGYINCAVSLEIIKGYPDGTFLPNKTVTYAEAATMLLRALNYTKELESLQYPTGYMTTANNAGILDNVTANSSREGASRGNIATMVLNTLKASVRKIVSTTTKGVVTYGDGAPLIESSFKDIKYIQDGEVVDIDFSDNEVYIRDKANSRRISATIEDEDELLGLYRRRVNCLYDNKNDKFLSFTIADEFKTLEVEVDEIDDDVIYDEDDEEYELPDSDDIIMAYVSNYNEVETAYLTMDGKKVLGAVLTGSPKIYIGLVTDNDVVVEKRKGFELLNPEGKYKEYPLSNTSEKIKKGAALLFSLNNSEYALIYDKIYRDDALSIEDVTTTSDGGSITLKKKSKVTFAKDTEYYIYIIDDDSIREAKLKDIDKEFDLGYIYKISDVYYVIIFEDSVDAEDIVSTLSVSEAKEKLQKTIKSANAYLKKETSYSVDTFEALVQAVDEGNAALNQSSSAAKLELAERKISQAISGLKGSSSSDKTLRSNWDDLQKKIKEAEGYKASDFTSASFAKLTAEIKTAKAVNLSNTTSAKITERIDELDRAINLLVTNTANTEIQTAIKKLNDLITKAEDAYKSKSDYTDSSISKLNTALTNAKKLDQTKASLAELKTQASNLEAALDGLEPKLLATYTSSRKTLDATYKDCTGRASTNYTKESYEIYQEKLSPLKTQYKSLKSLDEVAELSNTEIQNETAKVTSLNTKLKEALTFLVTVTDDTTRANLKKVIANGRAYTESTWTNSSISYKDLVAKLDAAEKIAKDSSKTEAEVQNALMDLMKYISM